MRDSFVFYRSYMKAIRKIKKPEDRLAMYDAISDYGLDGIAPGEDVPELVSVLMETIMPQIDANNVRYENGKKGGRPGKNKKPVVSEDSENKKPVVSESKTNGFESENHRFPSSKPNVNVNVDVNSNVDVNATTTDNALGSSGGRGRYNCDDDFNIWKKLTPEDIDAIYESYPESGGFLIDEVYKDVKTKRKQVENGLAYILGYAKNVGWDDSAEHT